VFARVKAGRDEEDGAIRVVWRRCRVGRSEKVLGALEERRVEGIDAGVKVGGGRVGLEVHVFAVYINSETVEGAGM
jgi:hypothetical protein